MTILKLSSKKCGSGTGVTVAGCGPIWRAGRQVINLAIDILLFSDKAVPCLNAILFHKTGTHSRIIVTLMSKTEATDRSDGVHVEANLSVGRRGILGHIDGWLCWWQGRCRGKWRPNGDASRWRGWWFAMADGSIVAGDKIFANLIENGPVT